MSMENDEKLLLTLLYLKGVFQQDSFRFFENSDTRRRALAESLREPFQIVSEYAHEMPYPDFTVLEQSVDSLDLSQCMAYLMYYLRLAYRQGGGDFFIKLWQNGTALQLTQRLLDMLDTRDRNRT